MKKEKKDKLRFEFIGMIFALAIAQIGFEIGDYFYLSKSINGFYDLSHLFVFSHLTLGTYIIASSWIGWQQSHSRGNQLVLTDSFSKAFFILLIDLLLVICYFIIIKGVEKPFSKEFAASELDSKTEAFWCMIIFGLFFIWDILTKVSPFKKNNLRRFRIRGWQSFACGIIAIIIYCLLTGENDAKSVILTDFALLLNFILFRALKVKKKIKLSNLKRKKKYSKYCLISASCIICIFMIFYFEKIDILLKNLHTSSI